MISIGWFMLLFTHGHREMVNAPDVENIECFPGNLIRVPLRKS
jgi:uncharacterized protein YlzI (FlbEa/FlbD family)